ncbi:hypothetical protein BHE74_00037768 [Ensete ventricosum]|nr:hypothetical protein GW17_00045554 [Ensete ventricosum]RWW55582.1 hypothetical protein BHE74_00037768 [Ensete ventricosum]RZS17008.1 hypothetical protein BHM03_00049103 [Ensete ventricosum]
MVFSSGLVFLSDPNKTRFLKWRSVLNNHTRAPEERQESKANARDWVFSFQWKKMRRQGQYADINPAIAAQMQHMSGQRLQHSSDMSHFSGGSDSFQHGEEHHYMPSKAEGQWQWDRDGTKGSNQISSQLYKEGRCCLA